MTYDKDRKRMFLFKKIIKKNKRKVKKKIFVGKGYLTGGLFKHSIFCLFLLA